MSLVRCSVRGCKWYVREGLVRHSYSDHLRELADGRRCWRCRQKSERAYRRLGKESELRKAKSQ